MGLQDDFDLEEEQHAKDLKGIEYKNEIFIGDRIYIKRIAQFPQGTFLQDEEKLFAFNTVYSLHNIKENPKYLLGIINSSLIKFWYENTYNLSMALTTQVTIEYLKMLPIKFLTSKLEKNIEQEIVSLVETMLRLNKEKQETNSADTLEQLQQRIQYTDDKINKLVYKLYDLTEEEIKIVEEKKIKKLRQSNFLVNKNLSA